MRQVFRGGSVWVDGNMQKADIALRDGAIEQIGKVAPRSGDSLFPCEGLHIFPGLADVHVHLREPGFSYKERMETGTAAAARGGFTAVCAMPNLSPVPDSAAHLEEELAIIQRGAKVDVYPYGALTVGEKGLEAADLEGMADKAVAFSDDGKGVQDAALMELAMRRAKKLGKIVCAHCEDEKLIGGCIHDGVYARRHGLKGIPAKAEWGQLERDLELAAKTGCAYHACHISCKESVSLVREAKRSGADVTCETAPHYLLLNERMLRDEGRFKMNPPIRGEADRQALLEGLLDGTVDMIATDHAPHSEKEKSGGLAGSLMGIVGLETAFPLLYTHLVRPGVIPLERLIELMCVSPRRRFGLSGELREGARADLTVFDLDASYPIRSEAFLSMGKSTPFDGWQVYGKCLMTLCGGRIAWQDKGFTPSGEQEEEIWQNART